ncbi:MAG: EAL domain-containing protein, partial [Burkholderiaceae bacterium]|nr:EAL domain-containing protein [Burkholderiaceae bacterium]
IWFVYRMVRDWSRPLNFAVSVADTIAAGREVNETEFQGQHDIGNLLQSLSGMYKSLKRYRAEVEASQSGLQEKIQQLSESKSSLAEAQRLARLGNWHWDCTSPTAYWSDEMYRILSASPSECEPALQTYLALMEPRSAENFDSKVKELTRVAGSVSDEQNIRAFDGNQRVVHHHVSSQANASGQVIRLCGTIQDITARRHAEQEIRRLALYDGLTGLPNRRYFLDQLEHTIAQARRSGEQVAAMFLDLDRFKRINDTLGHAAGDALLKEAARRLGQCVRDSDYVAREPNEPTDDESNVARLGGDEFTATLVDLKRPQDAAKVALRILHAMSEPFQIDGNDLVVTASVGIAVYPQDGDSAEVLLKNADTAMYRAKELGKNTYQFFTEDMNSTAFAKLTLESELQKALERDQFVLHYQPKIDIHSGKIAGVEALIRWSHPEWGLMAPGQFIALAEEIGLITVIGSWVMERACCQLKQWRDAGLPPISMAVNLASPSFRQPNLVHQVGALLKCYDVDAKLLQIEATESIMMTDVVTTMKTLTQLRELGVKLSIDDFGTGYSSLSYLRRFPIDQLKIDRSFVIDMVGNADAAAIAGAIVSLGTSLGLELVAEGVETQQQACLLRDMGCRMMQGYYFARPVPADEIAALLSNGTSFVLTPQQPEPEYPAGLTAEYA